MPEIGPSGSMSGEWKRDLRAPAPFLDSTEKRAKSGANQPSVEQFFIQKAMNDPEFAEIMQRVPFDFTKR